MARRGDADPLLLQAVSERLARLLAESPPGEEAEQLAAPAAVPTAMPTAGRTGPAGAAPAAATAEPTALDLADVDEVPPPRRFDRLHVGVVCLLLLAGLLWAGWTVLRARPVALAAPVTVSAGPTVGGQGMPTAAGSADPAGAAAGSGPPGSATAPATGTSAVPVVVHVLGAVRRPGLVSLPQPARVQDAVDAAGGLRRGADTGELNLAQLLVDGQQVVIGTEREPDGEVRGGAGSTTPGSADPGSSGGPGGAGTAAGGTVDLNTATPLQLEELPGVGPVTAAAIVAWRTEHGRFSRPEELQEVDGIGPKTYAQLEPHVRV